MQTPINAAQDEISLIDLIKIIHKRKVTFSIVLILAVGLSIFISAFMTPIYESKAFVLVGKVTGKYIENPDELTQRLIHEYSVDNNRRFKKPPFVYSITLNKKDSASIIEITARDTSADGAKAYLNLILKKLYQEHGTLYKNAYNLEEDHLTSMHAEINQFDVQLNKVKSLINSLKKSNPAQAAVLAVEAGQYLETKPRLEERYTALKIQLSEIDTRPSHALSGPTLPSDAVKPKALIYIILGLFVGILLGILATFMHEYTSILRQQLRAD